MRTLQIYLAAHLFLFLGKTIGSSCPSVTRPISVSFPQGSSANDTECQCHCKNVAQKTGTELMCKGNCTCFNGEDGNCSKEKQKEREQITSRLLMIRPRYFGFNPETAPDNSFQHKRIDEGTQICDSALKEFDSLVDVLRSNGLEVTVLADDEEPCAPDVIYPNWHSFHDDDNGGTLVLYPMNAHNRRLERKPTFLRQFQKHFQFKNTLDLTWLENEGEFLEATGSVLFDRVRNMAFANLSNRTSQFALIELSRKLGLVPVTFSAWMSKGIPIYHTDLMLSLGEKHVLICLECVRNDRERRGLEKVLKSTGRHIIPITREQINFYVGNQIQVKNKDGLRLLLMSTTAYGALTPDQKMELLKFNDKIITHDISTIEEVGGGSIKCLITEIFLPS